jgi:hypothetical protein
MPVFEPFGTLQVRRSFHRYFVRKTALERLPAYTTKIGACRLLRQFCPKVATSDHSANRMKTARQIEQNPGCFGRSWAALVASQATE